MNWKKVLAASIVSAVLVVSVKSYLLLRGLSRETEQFLAKAPVFTDFERLGHGPFEIGIFSISGDRPFACHSLSRDEITELIKKENLIVQVKGPGEFAGFGRSLSGLQVRSFRSAEECESFKGRLTSATR